MSPARHRFYAPTASRPGQRIRLPDGEGAHLRQVLRLTTGATVHVFDGRGHEFRGCIVSADRNGTLIDTLEPVSPALEPKVSLTLAQALLKGRKFDTVVRDAVMLGVAAVRPLTTAYTEVSEAALRGDAARTRWERIAVASAKQSGRAVVPAIEPPMSFDRHVSREADDLRIVLVEPTAAGVPDDQLAQLASRDRPRHATLTIGPEGGWSSEELDLARAEGWRLLTLGSRTLRADAAPVAAVSVLLFLWGDL